MRISDSAYVEYIKNAQKLTLYKDYFWDSRCCKSLILRCFCLVAAKAQSPKVGQLILSDHFFSSSGKRNTSPCSPPLRTARDSCPIKRLKPSTFQNPHTMQVTMTSLMEVNQVVDGIGSSFVQRHLMMCVNCFSIAQEVSAYWATPVLVLCNLMILRTSFPIGFAISGLTLFPIFL
jgi:hypothetical protein